MNEEYADIEGIAYLLNVRVSFHQDHLLRHLAQLCRQIRLPLLKSHLSLSTVIGVISLSQTLSTFSAEESCELAQMLFLR